MLQRLLTTLFRSSSTISLPLDEALSSIPAAEHPYFNHSTKPYVRWWWLQGPFYEQDIAYQLDWLRDNGFGGVEIAWLAPNWLRGATAPPRWLSAEWSELVALAFRLADERGLGCDFTFGSCWPFGGSFVPAEDASQVFRGPSLERLHGSWEDFDDAHCRVVNHLSSEALRNYSRVLIRALRPALAKGRTSLFCDSLEIQTEGLWTEALWDVFEARFGYRLEPHIDELDLRAEVRYDYRKLIADTICQEFYATFTEISHSSGAFSRVQCHGSPTDLLHSYASVDIPESEALLFEPHFSRIAASAAAMAGNPVVSAETFTCIHGFSHYRDLDLYRLWKKEDIRDLKLLADTLIANGVNQIVWHGMPYNSPEGRNEFYAAVHVGPDSELSGSFPVFNRYLSDVCQFMQAGKSFSQLAVYLPNEDNWMAGCIPEEERTPGATHLWQMRHVVPPAETVGYHPLWISLPFLRNATVENRVFKTGPVTFSALYVNCQWLDIEAIHQILRLARDGVPIVLKQRTKQPGHRPSPDYDRYLDELIALPNVVDRMSGLNMRPFVTGNCIPHYWARRADDAVLVFLAHPHSRFVRYPLKYRLSQAATKIRLRLTFSWGDRLKKIALVFQTNQSIVLRLPMHGAIQLIECNFHPKKN